MIISASRRTDIPAFYPEWFINRIRAGYCAVPNPFNRNQVAYVSLTPENVDVIVFWTRNPGPIIKYLPELDAKGYHCYFQYTIMDNPRELDPKTPRLEAAVRNFQQLADRIGPERVIWRYDPIALSPLTGPEFHLSRYRLIAGQLHGYTSRSVISVVDLYKKAGRRFQNLARQGFEINEYTGEPDEQFVHLMESMVEIAGSHGMEIFSCSETLDLGKYGIRPGKCVDDEYIQKVFGLQVAGKKDPNQRKECGCVVSKDIGMYDTCLFGCQYCYATSSFERARINHEQHDPESPSLVGWYEPMPRQMIKQERLFGVDYDSGS